MVTMIQTMECYPKELKLGDFVIAPAPEPDHEHCPKGYTQPELIGGWACPCPCHHKKPQAKTEVNALVALYELMNEED